MNWHRMTVPTASPGWAWPDAPARPRHCGILLRLERPCRMVSAATPDEAGSAAVNAHRDLTPRRACRPQAHARPPPRRIPCRSSPGRSCLRLPGRLRRGPRRLSSLPSAAQHARKATQPHGRGNWRRLRPADSEPHHRPSDAGGARVFALRSKVQQWHSILDTSYGNRSLALPKITHRNLKLTFKKANIRTEYPALPVSLHF
jgi:hypothetical protein